jgi:soluble lytic murein transglycosylase-like protein
VVGRKAFPWWGWAPGCVALAAVGLAMPAAAAPGPSPWCAGVPMAALPARDDGPKFALAEAACGPLRPVQQPGRAETAPRVAAQLALYDQPAVPAYATAAPPAAERPLPPRAVAAPRRAAATDGAAVQRIRALVPVVADAARRHGIDPLLLHAVAHVESRHQAAARSHAGARGVMQVMPGTARRFGLDDPQRELLQPELNVAVGAEYLKVLQARFGNNLPLVLAAYNAGEGAVEKHGRRIPPYPETQAYVRDVLATYAELRRRLGAPTAGVAGSV